MCFHQSIFFLLIFHTIIKVQLNLDYQCVTVQTRPKQTKESLDFRKSPLSNLIWRRTKDCNLRHQVRILPLPSFGAKRTKTSPPLVTSSLPWQVHNLKSLFSWTLQLYCSETRKDNLWQVLSFHCFKVNIVCDLTICQCNRMKCNRSFLPVAFLSPSPKSNNSLAKITSPRYV